MDSLEEPENNLWRLDLNPPYLLQLADHTGVDLRDAVERKLVMNAIKHPVSPGGPASVD